MHTGSNFFSVLDLVYPVYQVELPGQKFRCHQLTTQDSATVSNYARAADYLTNPDKETEKLGWYIKSNKDLYIFNNGMQLTKVSKKHSCTSQAIQL